MEKYYKIEGEELTDLLHTYYELTVLQNSFDDSYESKSKKEKEIVKERFPEATEEELKKMDLWDCAYADLENYVLAKES